MHPHFSIYLLLLLSIAHSLTGEIILGPAPVQPITPPPHAEIFSDYLESTAHFAVQLLNKEHKGNSTHPASFFELSRLKLEDARITEGIHYEMGVQFAHRPDVFQFQFVQPVKESEVPWLQNSLPSGETGSSLAIVTDASTPTFRNVELQGPIQLEFAQPREDIAFRLPHIIETNSVKSMHVNTGVKVQARGVTAFKLVDPVEVELKSSPTRNGLNIVFKQLPRVEIAGPSLSFVSEQRVKVKRSGNQRLEFTNATSTEAHRSTPLQIELTPDNPFMPYIEFMLQYSKGILSSSPTLNSKRIKHAHAEAVTLVLLPLELREVQSGVNSHWNVLISQDAYGNKRMVSSEQINISPPALSISPGLMHNTTLEEMLSQLGDMHISAISFE